jgi:hypothetical protein
MELDGDDGGRFKVGFKVVSKFLFCMDGHPQPTEYSFPTYFSGIQGDYYGNHSQRTYVCSFTSICVHGSMEDTLFLAPRGVAREGVLLQGLERGLEKSFRVFGIHPCYTFLTLATRRSATLHSSVPDGISRPVFLSSLAAKSKALPGAGPARPQFEKPAPQKA